MIAAEKGWTEIVKFLCQQDADHSKQNKVDKNSFSLLADLLFALGKTYDNALCCNIAVYMICGIDCTLYFPDSIK